MALTSGFFNSIGGDRKYNAEQVSEFFGGLISSGVLPNPSTNLQVMAKTGMTVQVMPGKGFIDSHWVKNDAYLDLAVETADSILNRIDAVVMKLNTDVGARKITIELKKGIPATAPVPPEMTREGGIQEYCLATILVGKLVNSVTQSNITDTRPNTKVCGWVTGLIEQIDTSTLFLQYQSAFDEWFSAIKETLATSTLIRSYHSVYTTSGPAETVIPIGISQFNKELDIFQVYINGLKLVPGVEYTLESNEHITLSKDVIAGTPISFEVFKSVDGSDAETVVQQVYELQQKTGKIEEFIYYATGVDDNKKLSDLAQSFYNASGRFTGIPANAQMKIKVVGNLGVSSYATGSGSSSDPFGWFLLGKFNNPHTVVDTSGSTRKLTFDFTNAQRISVGSDPGYMTVGFIGNDINMIGIQFVLGGDGATLNWFNGLNVNCLECMMFMNANSTAVGASQGGTFDKCRISVTSINGKANGLVSNGTTVLKAVDCEIIVYNGSGVTDESVGILAEANKTEGVVIVERCSLPVRSRGGYKQSQTVKINSGFYSLVSNMMGKAPALYSTDVSKGSNVGTLIISK